MELQKRDWIAIIGTREPSSEQRNAVTNLATSFDKDTQAIVSGCAFGVDALALVHAHNAGIPTIGMLPWTGYNTVIHPFCTETFAIPNMSQEIQNLAWQSVLHLHPNPAALSQGAKLLHMRNYLIIKWAKEVYAYPGAQLGGTGQGMRLAEHLGITLHINYGV